MIKSSNLEQYLNENGKLTYTFKGTSMNPMLKEGRDLYTLIPKTSRRCDKYDVVLYKKSPNLYVLHRIIEVRDKDYVIRGDNCISKEYGISDEDIIGVMTSFTHKGKEINVSDVRYMLYVRIWMILHSVIIILKRIKAKFSHKIRR